MRTLIWTALLIATCFFEMTAQNRIYISANGETRTATLSDNAATEELRRMLADGPLTVSMHDYGGWEKVGDLPQSLPTSNSQISAQPGDIMLYQGYQMVIFYGVNSWSYTRLGKIDGATAANLKSWLGSGNVEVTLSLSLSTGVDTISDDKDINGKVYDLMGRIVKGRPLNPGTYVINGKKTVVH